MKHVLNIQFLTKLKYLILLIHHAKYIIKCLFMISGWIFCRAFVDFLVEHRTGIRGGHMGSNPVEALKIFLGFFSPIA